MSPFLGCAQRGRRNRAHSSGGGIAAAILAVGVARGAEAGGAEDAAVRQQVGIPGGRRHADRHAAGETPPRCCTKWARYLATVPEVTDYQAYAGTSRADQLQRPGAPVLPARRRRRLGDLQVNLVDKHHRNRKSHEIARRGAARTGRDRASATAPTVKVVEVPPGPPVLSPIVAEVYGPDYAGQIAVAQAAFAPSSPQRRHRRRRRLASTTAAPKLVAARRSGARRRLLGVAAARHRRHDAHGAGRRGRHAAARRRRQV